jgi:hypothetical protein
MPGGVKLIDSTLVVEIDRELAPPADALRVALMMLKVMAQNWPTSAAQRRKAARASSADHCGGRHNVSSCGRTRPIDAHRESLRFSLKVTHSGPRMSN